MNNMSRKSIDSRDVVPKGQRLAQVQNFSPEQMNQFESLFSHVGPDSYLSRLAGGDQSMYEEMEAPAWRQFQEAQGRTSSRFSGQGLGGRNSSAFQNEMGQMGSDFAMNLRSQRLGLRNQALQELMQYSNMLLGQRPTEKAMYDKQQSSGPDWWGIGGGLLGAAGGALLGGPGGAVAGSQLGYGIGSGKGGQNAAQGFERLAGYLPNEWGSNSMNSSGNYGGGGYSSYGRSGSGGISTSSGLNPLLY